MGVRTPSLRELRRACPANVAILPTAAARQVQQHYGREYQATKRELISSQHAVFPYIMPAIRELQAKAEDAERLAHCQSSRPVPEFDPSNPVHVKAWQSIWDG